MNPRTVNMNELGKALTEQLLAAGQKAGLHTVLVRIARENAASLHLIRLFGFDSVGVMREVGKTAVASDSAIIPSGKSITRQA